MSPIFWKLDPWVRKEEQSCFVMWEKLLSHSEALHAIFLFILKTLLFLFNISHQTKYLKLLRSTVTFCFVNRILTYSAITVFVICLVIQWKSDDRCCQAVMNSFSITVQALEWFILCKVFGKNGNILNLFKQQEKIIKLNLLPAWVLCVGMQHLTTTVRGVEPTKPRLEKVS